MKTPTKRQLVVLGFIRSFIELRSYPPTIREIANHFNITIKAAYDHVKALEKKKMIASKTNRPRTIEIIEPVEELICVPLLSHVATRKPLLAEENFEDTLSLPKKLVGNGDLFAFRVKGDSMTGACIQDGDIAVFVRQKVAKSGQIVVVNINDTITIRPFFRKKKQIRFQSENPDYSPIDTHNSRILGRIVAIIRTL